MPNPIQGKNILLGVTGSIAAYKAADLASKLTQAGANVEAILTASAREFITPLTLQSVTGRRAFTDEDLWGSQGHVTHIGLGRAGDLLVIAPASANTIAKLAHGFGDNLLTVTALAAHCPVIVAPAMDAGMYDHPATQANVRILLDRGVHFIGPMPGHLASGLVGVGRMAEPADIIGSIRFQLGRSGPLAGRRIVVTAGGTQEPIDPVRFIANRSSGKQGYAIAQAALDLGAAVTLITTPVNISPPAGCELVQVRTAQEMRDAVLSAASEVTALIMAAAVADFTPRQPSANKIKKRTGPPEIDLTFTPDILTEVAQAKKGSGYPLRVIGFAAESGDLLKNAGEKLASKNLDMIVANDISAKDAGFEVDTNRVVFIYADGSQRAFPNMPKAEVAAEVLAQVAAWFTDDSEVTE